MGKPVILVVDDQIFICETIVALLENTYEVHAYTAGAEAIKYIKNNPVDLALLDYSMPTMSGYEVLMNIKSNPSTSKIPVIFLTAETNERMRMEMIDRGASDYIHKPVNAPVLHECIKKHLKK